MTLANDYKLVRVQRHPDNSVKFERVEEEELIPLFLRNRSSLAYLYFKKLLQPKEYTGVSAQVYNACVNGVLYTPLTDQGAINEAYHNYAELMVLSKLGAHDDSAQSLIKPTVGGVVISTDRTAAWRDQFPAIFLNHGVTPDDLIDAFTPAMQWLKDRPQAMRTLDTIWRVHA